MILLGVFALIFGVNKTNNKGVEENRKGLNAGAIINGDKAYISSAQVIQTKTGTGPWDSNDESGNDSSENNNIVRSFDQVTYTVDLTMALKKSNTDTSLKGGVINVEAVLPENCANVMKWDLDAMKWIEEGKLSGDGRSLTGKYSMSNTETTIPGKQTLVFVLKVEGAGNRTEIEPSFKFNLEGNNENEIISTMGTKTIVSAKGKYNIQLYRNERLATKTNVDYGEGLKEGRMYGYTFAVQLYNENAEKGLKGIEYPKGEISFDINLKLERSKFESKELEDITNECTPILWQYGVPSWDNIYGNIPNRKYLNDNSKYVYDAQLPLGKFKDPNYSTYNSGDISIVQEDSNLKVKFKDYKINGIFPYYNSAWITAKLEDRHKIYTENIGTFSIVYLQLFVPDNGASTIEDRNYYLTVSDNNINMTSITNEIISSQMKSSDDSSKVQHVLYNPGSYSQEIWTYNSNGNLGTSYVAGDAKVTLGEEIIIKTKFNNSLLNDYDINTANRFIKFDGEAFEPTYFSNGSKYQIESMRGDAKFRLWYATKKDGTNWENQQEMNNGNIEDMDIYDNIEDIPKNKICIGVYVETISGYISRFTGTNNVIKIAVKIKETATIGKTYGITQRTQVWIDKLDRNKYSVLHPENKYPKPTWDSGNRQYVKTEYDENGNMIAGTHSGGITYGNTVLVTGTNLHGNIQAIENNKEKVNYDLGKNENVATYEVQPVIDRNANISTQIENVTLKTEVTLPQGLTYVSGSSKRGETAYSEPNIETNKDGGSKLTWNIYNCKSGEEIQPIIFEANINNETRNGEQYTTKFIISEVIGKDGTSKIGNSEIKNRTSSETINIINLASHRLYKETEAPIVEKGENIEYNISYKNNTEEVINEFQLLDILPYNGDGRGTKYNGTYILENIELTGQTGLKIYTTTDESVRNITAKDENIGKSPMWKEVTAGRIGEEVKGIAVKGTVNGKNKVDIKLTLKPEGNLSKDIYVNNVTTQTNKNSEVMTSTNIKVQVVSRAIKGKIWEDSNSNGVINSKEKYLEGITVKLLNSSNAEIARTLSNAQGEYEFTNLAKGIYKVEVEIDNLHELTEKEIGTNREINSKFNQSSKQTDEITKLNTISSPDIIEENVNAGIRRIATNVLVHHYKEGTTEKVPSRNGGIVEDELIEGKVGDNYTTNASNNIAQNYELVAEPNNKNGTMTESQIVVTYYYRLKTPSITNQVINKTGTDRITIVNQEMSYTVTYRANIVDYIGNAEVTIVDTLPYAIDEAKSDLAGGVYDANARTITWKENVENINSFADTNATNEVLDDANTTGAKIVANGGTVEVTKTFKVVYTGLDMNQEKVVNNVSGNIKLLTPEKTSEEVTGNQESTIYKAIISAEKLVDKQEATEGEKVTYTVRIKNEGNLAKTVTLRDTLPAGLTFDKNTLIQVGNVGTVYTEQNLKNGIPVEVPAKGTVDVKFAGIVDVLANDAFSKTLENQATIDNELTNKVTTNVTKPNITAHKESTPSSGNKVLEGDEIIYKIKVRNDGTREGTVVVKDTVPTGTTFVEGSVKIDGIANKDKTANDLANGINLTVGVGKEIVLEFKVTVNKLADRTKIKNTAYINEGKEDKKVPEEPEHTYVEPKAEQNITKNGTSKIEALDQEITYNIAYTARISDYKGNAKVVLVDKLPYAIDETRSDLAGGTYNAENNTITWEEPVENIQLTETKEVTVNKTIKVVYTGISKDVTSVKNTVTGHIEYETPIRTSEDVTANHITTTGFTINIPVSKVWEDDNNKLGQRPTKVVFKLTGSDGSEYVKEMSKPGTAGSTTTQDQTNPNKWNDIFENLPKYDVNNKEIIYTLTEEEKTEGDLRYYDSVVTDKIVTNTNKYGKVTVHHYIMNTDGSTTTTRVPNVSGAEVEDTVIEGKVGDPYKTESAKNINEKYELVAEKLPANTTGTLEKYNAEKEQEVIYYYKLKPAKVIINYLEKDEETDDSNNQVLADKAEINGHVDDKYNTNTNHRKETIEKEGKTYTLVSNSENTEGIMKLQDTVVTYYYLQNTKATVRYVERNPETGEIVKDLEEPTVKEGLVGEEFVTNAKNFLGYKLVESPEKTTINLSKEEQTLIYYYEPVYSGLVENHIDEVSGKVLETKVHDIQVGKEYNIPSKVFEGYDLVETKLPENATGTMGEELITVNYYYIKKAVLEVIYLDVLTNTPLTEQIVDSTKHEGDKYTTTAMEFANYDLVEMPTNAEGTLNVETDAEGNITNNKTIVTYYYAKKSAGVEEQHIDIRTNKEIEEPIIHEGHVGDEYEIKAKDFLSYKLVEKDEEGNSKLPENAKGQMAEEKIVVKYYYNQPAKVVVHYIEKATGKELEEINQETGELQNSQIVIEGQKDDEYKTEAKEFEYYTLLEKELPQNAEGKMKVEIVENEKGEKIVNNTIDVYYYYQAKSSNIGVEKEITGIMVNGEKKEISNGKVKKVEIYRKKTEETSVQVEYKIKVMNTGEIAGTATIEENIPEGMKLANNDGTWEEKEGKLIKVIPEIGAGETKEYTVLLNWEQTEVNMGEKANEVRLVETGNVPGFVDNNDKDNTSKANVIISVETGAEIPVVLLLVLVGLVGLETVTLKYAVVLTKKQKKKF